MIRPDAWYLDGDRVAPCVAMEAGQADLVLSGYLGVDFETRGQSVYRLLDANVTFHRGLPVVGRRDALRHPHHPVLPPGHDDPVPVRVRRDRGRRAPDHDARWLRRLLHAPRSWPPARGSCRAGSIRGAAGVAIPLRDDRELIPMSPDATGRGRGRRPPPGRPGGGLRRPIRRAADLTDPIALAGRPDDDDPPRRDARPVGRTGRAGTRSAPRPISSPATGTWSATSSTTASCPAR